MFFRDPQGQTHQYYLCETKDNQVQAATPPNEWRDLETVVILPEDSAPGTWGISELTLHEKPETLKHSTLLK